ncbi:unnamed protein product [Rotaria sp. Silwood2]|nr:unnamed protein product [Rotaria sp. Silwood2]
MERFLNVIEKSLIPSMTMKFNKFTIVGSCLIDKGLLVLLHLISLNSSILMFLQLQSRPWSCHILYTLSIPSSIHNSIKFLSINSLLSIFIDEEKNQNGFYIIDNNKENFRRNIEFIPCSLSTYIYCYLHDNYYWLMGTEIDLNMQRKLIKVYYGCSTCSSRSLVSFNTNKFIPISLVDNIQDIHIINHKIQLKTRLILGDLIISNIQSVEIFQYGENFLLTPYINTNETANYILIDDFNHIGWKQILFLKNDFNLNSFMLTDFSQIHIFQQESNYEYNTEEKLLSIEMDDADIQTSFALAQDILRKKIITETKSLIQNSNISTSILQLIETNWFVYRTNLFLYATIKNPTNLTSVYLFGIDKNSNKIKLFNLKTAFQSSLNEQTIFNLNSCSCGTFILTTIIELDKDIDIELYLLIDDDNKLFHVGSINILIDDLMNPNNERILKLNALETESSLFD